MTTPHLAAFKVPAIDNEPMVSIHEHPVLSGYIDLGHMDRKPTRLVR